MRAEVAGKGKRELCSSSSPAFLANNHSVPKKRSHIHTHGSQPALAFYILFALFIDNFVIIFVATVLLAALDFWVVRNVSGRILVGLRRWNEINDLGESVWRFECLDQESIAQLNKKDSWLFWWTLYLNAVAWIVLAIFSLIRLQADYVLVAGVCFTLSIANIVGFTKCQKDAKKQIQKFATRTITSRFSSTLQSAFSFVWVAYYQTCRFKQNFALLEFKSGEMCSSWLHNDDLASIRAGFSFLIDY